MLILIDFALVTKVGQVNTHNTKLALLSHFIGLQVICQCFVFIFVKCAAVNVYCEMNV